MPKPKPVHFTHHLCIVADSSARDAYRRTSGLDGGFSFNFFDREFPHNRQPQYAGPYSCRPAGKAPCFTTDLVAVTCAKCITGLREEAEEPWVALRRSNRWNGQEGGDQRATWVDDGELEARAWLLCCRAVVPRPSWLPQENVDQFDRNRSAVAVRDLFWLLTYENAGYPSARFRKKLNESVSRIADEHRDVLRPVIEQLTMLGDVLEHVDEIRGRADSLLTEITDRIRAGEAEVGPIAPRETSLEESCEHFDRQRSAEARAA